METIHSTPVLQAKAKTGKTKFWQGHVGREGGKIYTFTTYWQDGSVVQTSAPTLIERKNVGRSNETTEEFQAKFEIESEYKKQRDEGYRQEGEEYDGLLLPMLAHVYEDRGHDIVWEAGVHVQPKLDGARALSDGTRFWSRKGKMWGEDITRHMRFPNPSGRLWDGEFMLPKGELFEHLASAVKKFYPQWTPLLTFNVFDVVMPEAFEARHQAVREHVSALGNPNVLAVETHKVRNVGEVEEHYDRFCEQEFEGCMIRANAVLSGRGKSKQPEPQGYAVNERATHLLKYKPFVDEEFTILAAGEGKGRDKGAIMFRCRTKAGVEFDVRPAWTYEKRQAAMSIAASFVGKPLTVEFQNYTKYGKPRFPVGKAIRDYE